tara:strand:+ start:287 stop:466 length:180 start_codon:yes stop_codon:yes gene_type:complete
MIRTGDLVKLSDEIYEPEIVQDWGIGTVVRVSIAYKTISVWWWKQGFERVFATKAVEVL